MHTDHFWHHQHNLCQVSYPSLLRWTFVKTTVNSPLYRTAMKIFFEKKNRRQDEMNLDSGKRDIKLIQKSLKMVKIAQQKNEMLVLESIKSSHENVEKPQKVLQHNSQGQIFLEKVLCF